MRPMRWGSPSATRMRRARSRRWRAEAEAWRPHAGGRAARWRDERDGAPAKPASPERCRKERRRQSAPMYALFEEGGRFLAGRVMAESEASAQIELESGKRVKVKSAHLLLKFAEPAPAELIA